MKRPITTPYMSPRLLAFKVTVTAGVPVITVGGEQATITDGGVGIYTLTFIKPFKRVPFVIAQAFGGTSTAFNCTVQDAQRTATAVTIRTATLAGVATDTSFYCLVLGFDSTDTRNISPLERNIKTPDHGCRILYNTLKIHGVGTGASAPATVAKTFLSRGATGVAGHLTVGTSNARIHLESRQYGPESNKISLTMVASPDSASHVVSVSGTDITVLLQNTAGVPAGTAQGVCTAINAHPEAKNLVKANVGYGLSYRGNGASIGTWSHPYWDANFASTSYITDQATLTLDSRYAFARDCMVFCISQTDSSATDGVDDAFKCHGHVVSATSSQIKIIPFFTDGTSVQPGNLHLLIVGFDSPTEAATQEANKTVMGNQLKSRLIPVDVLNTAGTLSLRNGTGSALTLADIGTGESTITLRKPGGYSSMYWGMAVSSTLSHGCLRRPDSDLKTSFKALSAVLSTGSAVDTSQNGLALVIDTSDQK